MDELLAYLMAAAVQLSGLPALAERPPVTPMPYQKMLLEICADLKEESVRMLAQYDLCTHGQSVADKNCEALKPDPEPYAQCTSQTGLVAAYILEQRRIVYREDLNLENDADNSFIVHEFVHALQDAQHGGKMFDTCAGVIAAEREAYSVQQRYLYFRGQMLRVGERLRMVGCEGLQ